MKNIKNFNFEYENYDELKNKEPLFLIPDGVRTRYPIGWNGYGRYLPNTLKIYDMKNKRYLERDVEYTEEDNGVFYNFIKAPEIGSEYIIENITRPEDYVFSTGKDIDGYTAEYPGEEYFLFPNWNNAPGCCDAFWVGKYMASRQDATAGNQGSSDIPQSKKGVSAWADVTMIKAINSIKNKGNNFHILINREWMSIAYWCNHHKLDEILSGNINGEYDPTNADYKGTNINSFIDTSDPYKKTLTGMGPDTWNHNLQSNGISDMVGNLCEMIDGITLDWKLSGKGVAIHFFNENNEYDNTNIMQITDFDGDIDIMNDREIDWYIKYIYYEDNKYKYEGIPTNRTDINTLKPTRSNEEYFSCYNNINMNSLFRTNNDWNVAYRSGSTHTEIDGGLFFLTLYDYKASSMCLYDLGFRIVSELI